MISIQTNIAALYGQENYTANANFEQQTIQQLTSGYRINSSADDAAGLAIANQLHTQETELTQGVSNANDGVSQLQIIDGGLTNITQILNTLQTLATEAASSTFTGNFATLNTEFQDDLGELNRQASNIGLNTGGDFNATLSVYVGGGIGVNDGEAIGTNLENVVLGNATATQVAVTSTGSAGGTGVTVSYAVTSYSSGTSQSSQSSQSSFSSVSASYYAGTNGTYTAASNTSSASGNVTGYSASGATAVSESVGTGTQSSQSSQSSVSSYASQGTTSSASFTATQTAITSTYLNSVDAYSLGLATGTAASAATNLNITNASNAQAAITAISAAVVNLGKVQGVVGAGINQLNFAVGLAQSQITNYTADESGIRDANIAQEASNLTKSQVLSQSSIAALAQANQEPQDLLKLLQ